MGKSMMSLPYEATDHECSSTISVAPTEDIPNFEARKPIQGLERDRRTPKCETTLDLLAEVLEEEDTQMARWYTSPTKLDPVYLVDDDPCSFAWQTRGQRTSKLDDHGSAHECSTEDSFVRGDASSKHCEYDDDTEPTSTISF